MARAIVHGSVLTLQVPLDGDKIRDEDMVKAMGVLLVYSGWTPVVSSRPLAGIFNEAIVRWQQAVERPPMQ